MKKYLTCTLLFISITNFSGAQENISNDFANISTPFKYIFGDPPTDKNFLFEAWVKAKILTSNNSIITNDSFLFNFDKINRRLLITTDFNSIFEIDNREFKAILFYRHDSTLLFKHVNFINEKDLFQVLVNNPNKYSLYKVMRTKIVKNLYSNTIHLSPSGKPIDLYVDIPEYYVFFPNKEYRKIHTLKRGSIERIFKLNPELDIVEEYFRLLGDKDKYEEGELIALVAYLNKAEP